MPEHRTDEPGTPVTPEQKAERAEEIAVLLSDNKVWHSHGRMISMKKLREMVRLEIDDFGEDADLRDAIRRYSDTLSDYLVRQNMDFFIFNRHVH